MSEPQSQSIQVAEPAPRPEDSPLWFRNRRSDLRRTYFRGGRYFTVGHEWYVSLREGMDLGPYPNRDAAEMALAMHVAQCCLTSPGAIAELFEHDESAATEFEIIVRELTEGLEQRQLRSENCAYVWAEQRIDELRRHPANRSLARTKALKYLLQELED